jgi:hypothetical protein
MKGERDIRDSFIISRPKLFGFICEESESEFSLSSSAPLPRRLFFGKIAKKGIWNLPSVLRRESCDKG